jgi:predicted lipoprotein with Yx(FWY)xxD motif
MIRRSLVFLIVTITLAALALIRLTGISYAYDVSLRYPSEVALSLEGDKGYVFRRFPGSQRLYTYDKDNPTHSACNIGCDGAHVPVFAPVDAKVLDEWSIVVRDDGTHQWSFRGKPIYTAFHDPAGNPRGDGEDGLWHLVPYEK